MNVNKHLFLSPMTVVSGALLSIGIIPQLSNGALSVVTDNREWTSRETRQDGMRYDEWRVSLATDSLTVTLLWTCFQHHLKAFLFCCHQHIEHVRLSSSGDDALFKLTLYLLTTTHQGWGCIFKYHRHKWQQEGWADQTRVPLIISENGLSQHHGVNPQRLLSAPTQSIRILTVMLTPRRHHVTFTVTGWN